MTKFPITIVCAPALTLKTYEFYLRTFFFSVPKSWNWWLHNKAFKFTRLPGVGKPGIRATLPLAVTVQLEPGTYTLGGGLKRDHRSTIVVFEDGSFKHLMPIRKKTKGKKVTFENLVIRHGVADIDAGIPAWV